MPHEVKAASLLARLNLDRPELANLHAADNPVTAYLEHLTRPDRGRFRFEHSRKTEILAFLNESYPCWQRFNTAPAQALADLTVEQARKPRALATCSTLGRAWWATGDPKWGAAFQRFYVETATSEMFNWSSFNGTQAHVELDPWFMLLDCPGFTEAGRVAFLDHLFALVANAWDIHTSKWSQLMLGPEGHNWYLHGMHGLLHIGLLFPELRRADFYVRTGWSVVEEHVRGHYKADGGARETTLGYQAGSMMNLWDFYTIASRNGVPISAGFADRLLNATHFLLRLAAPDGGLPSFGDGGHKPGALHNLAAVAAALTGDRVCKGYAERFRQCASNAGDSAPGVLPYASFFAVGLTGARTYAATVAQDPDRVSVLMGDTGYAALRAGQGNDAPYLAIAAADRGPIVTSHGHNDVFALDVQAFGQRFIGEMGCAGYGVSPGREYDQFTAAHSTLAIDGMEQTPLRGEWRWTNRTIPAVRRWISDAEHDVLHGVHEGFYLWPEHQTLHSRKVVMLKGEPTCWVVFDVIESLVDNPCSIYFHGATHGVIDPSGALIFGDDAAAGRLAVVPPRDDALTPDVVDTPGRDAYFKEKGLKVEDYDAFAYHQTVKRHSFVWVLAPLGEGDAIPAVKRLPVTCNGDAAEAGEVTAVEIAWRGHVDRVLVSHLDFDADLTLAGEALWGHLAIRRLDAAGKVQSSITHTMPDGIVGR